MASNKEVVTYKRKRFSSQSHLVHGTSSANFASQKIEFGTYDEELNKACAHCFKCCDFNINENLVACECCSRTYHVQCMDPPQKGKWKCSACTGRHDSKEPLQDHVRESKRARKNKIIVEYDMGPMKLRSHKVLSSIKHADGSSKNASSSSIDSSICKAAESVQTGSSYSKPGETSRTTWVEGSSSPNLTDLDDKQKSSPVCVASFTKRCTESIILAVNSDGPGNGLSNVENSKENCSTPFITFCRRVKKKQDVNEIPGRSSNAEEKLSSSATCSSHVIEASSNNEGSSPNCSVKERLTRAPALLEQTEGTNVEKETGLRSTPYGGFVETKIASDKCEEPHIGNQHPVPSEPANIPEDPSDKIITASKIDGMKDSLHDNKQPNSADADAPVREDLGKKLAIIASDETALPYNISKRRDHMSGLKLSVTLPSSTCLRSIESSKPSVDVVPKNLLESKNSSTPSCAVVLVDDETDGRGKELEWLEDLDKLLREKKKERDTCSVIEQGDINCGQASNGTAFMTPKSSAQSPRDQDASVECLNLVGTLQRRASPTTLDYTVCKRKQHEETPNKSSLCTNFLGLPPHLNSEAHDDSVKDFHGTLTSSSSGVKEYFPLHSRPLSWQGLDESSSLQRHKQIVDNVLIGTQMLKEQQGSRRYSSDWSEEELDFLWIGVRRHGIDNWNAMLKDSKLRFLESRVAEDLAMRWDLEQRKLMNSTLFQPSRLTRSDRSYSTVMIDTVLPKRPAGNYYGSYSTCSYASSEFPMLAAETGLSLGDVYRQKEKAPRRNLFHSSFVGTCNPFRSESSSTGSFISSFSIGSVYPKAGFRYQKPIRTQNTMSDWESPTLLQQNFSERTDEHQSACKPVDGNNLPHWLKEVMSTGPQPSELLPVVSSTALSMSLLNNDLHVSSPFSYQGEPVAPPKDPRGRGILKTKSKSCGGNIDGLRINKRTSPNEPWMEAQAGRMPAPVQTPQKPTSDNAPSEQNFISNVNRKSLDPVGPSDLVVIDSDASSEETISDDQSSRP